jgi:uncharacterized protein (TIGR02284 family)
MDDDDTIDTLNDLIETTKDGEYGFRTSAEQAHDPQLKQVFMKRADECAQAARELQEQVIQLGGDAEDSGTTAGAMHRGWVAVKSTLSGYNDLQILEETERGEDKALHTYQKAMQSALPPQVAQVVARQLEGVRRNHDQVRALRNTARAAAGSTAN